MAHRTLCFRSLQGIGFCRHCRNEVGHGVGVNSEALENALKIVERVRRARGFDIGWTGKSGHSIHSGYTLVQGVELR